MATFNATQPITDPSIFSPRGMYVDNRSSKTYLGDDDEDEPKAFVLDASDMKALNRFLGTGRKLQTTRVEYLRWLGISDNSGEISTDLGKELELLLRTYSSIKTDCIEFKDKTWNRIVDIAGDIKSYATMSGGKVTTSYYVLMLTFIGQYHEENKKPNPDEGKLAELKESILFTVNAELRKLGELQAGAQEALEGLGNFEAVCEQHSTAVETNATTLEAQLKKEGNDIETMKTKIGEAQDEITDLQKQIDGKNKAIKDAPKYMWVGLIGMAIGTGIIVEAKKAIKRLKAAMEKVQALLDDYESKMKTASRLETNLMFISGQVTDLSTEIGPAITTLQKLQGAWRNMETDLKAIKDLVEFDAENIPPVMITKPQLEGIVDAWNELKDYASAYIENAYLSDDPKSVTIKEYIAELDDAILKIEAMEKAL